MDLRTLDALVAEGVMGRTIWDEHRSLRCYGGGPPMVLDGPNVAKYPNAERNCIYGTVPLYSSELSTAWHVMVTVLNDEEAYEFAIALMEMCGAVANLGETHVNLVLRILNYLTPEHICLAALRANGVEVPE